MSKFPFTVLTPGDHFRGSLTPAIFLAGPTPRSKDVQSWRPDALNILNELDFHGIVLVPERADWSVKFDYDDQVEWEWHGLDYCDSMVFWVPRHIPTMLGLTTNVEFGMHVSSKKMYYGRPEGAPHTRYLDCLYTKKTGNEPCSDLRVLLQQAICMAIHNSEAKSVMASFLGVG